jgi:hypothetical protein
MGQQDMLARLLRGNPDPSLPGYPVMQSSEGRGFKPIPFQGEGFQRMAAVLRGDVEPTPGEQMGMNVVRGFTEGPATIRAFHGSPHRFDRFDMSRIGTGEGAQAYGHGLYFAGNEGVAKGYRDRLAPPPPTSQTVSIGGKTFADLFPNDIPGRGPASAQVIAHGGDIDQAITTLRARGSGLSARSASLLEPYRGQRATISIPEPSGHIYEVNLNTTPDRLLDWDAPFERQLPQIQNAMSDVFGRDELAGSSNKTIGHRFGALSINQFGREGGDAAASAALREAGIPGIQYLDAGSRAAGDGTRNYVMFDDKLIDILRRYGIAGTLGGGAAATAGTSE